LQQRLYVSVLTSQHARCFISRLFILDVFGLHVILLPDRPGKNAKIIATKHALLKRKSQTIFILSNSVLRHVLFASI